jgi:hypothetical protein
MADSKVSDLIEVVDMGSFDYFYIIINGESRRISRANLEDDLTIAHALDADNLGGLSAASYAPTDNPTFTGTTNTGNLRVAGDIIATSDITAYSDRRLKEDIVSIPDALDKVSRINGVTFRRIDTGDTQTGLIAQELRAILPEAVSEDEDGYLSVAYGNVVGLLVEAIKELREEVDSLKGI